MTIDQLPTPSVLIDVDALGRNIRAMQEACDRGGVKLWPHIKTHKCVEILRMQLQAGATGITCAKIGEAEAMLPSGVRNVFLAHSLVDPALIPRLRTLAGKLDRLILAVTSQPHAEHLDRLLTSAGLAFPVFVAMDTGLGREGARSLTAFADIVRFASASRSLDPVGVYCHEGHTYRSAAVEDIDRLTVEVHEKISAAAGILPPGSEVAPGCSVSASRLAAMPGVTMVRPGAYPLGDLNLAHRLPLMAWSDCAATLLATVVDRPDAGLAILDAGSKSFSGDKDAQGQSALALRNREIAVSGVNEEHGYVRGPQADALRIGDRLRFVPAHVCTMMNMADEVYAVSGDTVLDTWKIQGRGKVH
ncbi:MAG TPA: alanine racemase [Terrimicrobiaceae bacterium]|nr:alanine racemase [Terrimicrobiaceae bacterium]